jgi:hypothetical protein
MTCKPIFIENSKLPVWLSKLAPINIWAFSFAFFVVCRGKLTKETRRHETIHYHQQIELLFVFQWILYGAFYLIGRFKHGTWADAYYLNPFEQEAYSNDGVEGYLNQRKHWAWVKYV